MKISAGTCIIYQNKILFCHPTNGAWEGTFSPAKGGVDEGEELIDAAIRETKEEIGITISKNQIFNTKEPLEIVYFTKKKTIHKIVYLYIVKINNLSEIGLLSEIVPKKQLQIEEVDFCRFYTKDEAKPLIFHRFLPLLDLI